MGPPWYDVCAPMEQHSFRQIFVSDQCHADFEEAFASLDVAALRLWMRESRGCFREWAHFSWLAFLRQDPKMARLAWEHQLAMIAERVAPDLETLLVRGTTGEIGAEAVQHTTAFLDEVERDQSFKEEMEQAYAAVTPICLYHLDTQCVGAMKKVLGWMYPRSYQLPGPPRESFTFSMVPFYREVFRDVTTLRAASRMALDLLNAIEDGGATRAPSRLVPSDVMTMGLAAFDGDEDRFWKFMIVYATRGAAWATASALAHDDTRPLLAAFMVISAAMGVLDTAALPSGSPWSYPEGSVSTCFQPKPYHFWMAGGYAYLLRKEAYGARTSKRVARLLGAMYELGSTTMDRDPNAVFFVPTYHTLVNRARREVTHHYLGAELGAASAEASWERNPIDAAQLDFDATLLAMMEHSEPLPELTDADMLKQLEDAPTKWRYWTDLTGWYLRAD